MALLITKKPRLKSKNSFQKRLQVIDLQALFYFGPLAVWLCPCIMT
ncbi:MAG: hypothetical protein ACJA2P_002554, partial [Rhodoferax sp.]